MSADNSALLLEIFRAIEARNGGRFADLLDDDFEISWPPSLPYGGTSRGVNAKHPTWGETWDPLQPTAEERRMDPRVVAANDRKVVVLWRQRGMSPSGEKFDGEVLGLYEVGNGKLKRAQMFYFDTAAVVDFLARAKPQAS